MFMKRLWIFITIFFFVTAAVVIYQTADYSFTHAESDTVVEDSLLTITISFVGDLMCHSPQYNYARVDKDSFDFRPVFREVMQFFQSSDFTIGNLETVTAGKNAGYSGYPLFNTPDEYIYALKYAGFDLLVTANNHSMDQGEQGVLRTIEQIKFNGLNYTGTALDKTDRDSIRIFDLNGIKVSVLSYTYGTNNIPKPKGKDYLVNVIDYGLIRDDITSARRVKSGHHYSLLSFW
jgi:2',3'-cyclic-nucleotide 2'-phosphodiesterase (5'-nucleotidase family)